MAYNSTVLLSLMAVATAFLVHCAAGQAVVGFIDLQNRILCDNVGTDLDVVETSCDNGIREPVYLQAVRNSKDSVNIQIDKAATGTIQNRECVGMTFFWTERGPCEAFSVANFHSEAGLQVGRGGANILVHDISLDSIFGGIGFRLVLKFTIVSA